MEDPIRELIRARPALVVDLLEYVCPGIVPPYDTVRVESGEPHVMGPGTREYERDLARRWYGRGKAEGEVDGEARMLLAVLSARGIAVSDEARARIVACIDTDLLETWGCRAVEAETIDDLFD
jgi:hypothetical protein